MRKRLDVNALVYGVAIASLLTGLAHAGSTAAGEAPVSVDAAPPTHTARSHEPSKFSRDAAFPGGANVRNTEPQNAPSCEGSPSFCNTYFGGS